jgi:ferredoxin
VNVWVDSDLCSGCGKCVEAAPEVFVHIDGLSHVKQATGAILGSMVVATVPVKHEAAVIYAAEECPGEIIMIEITHDDINPGEYLINICNI